jgi:hypothetical protein
MPIGHITEVDEGTLEQYDQVSEKIIENGPPADGLLCHFAGAKEGGGFMIFEVWESEDQFRRFQEERVGPAVTEVVGPDSEPSRREVFEIHNQMMVGQER